jgi:hypothetical protein
VVAAVSDGTASPATLSHRAMELSRDPGVSLTEGAQHLVRLAQGRSLPLECALADLDREPANFEVEYARLLLRDAIGEVAKPSRVGGSHLEPAN